MSLCHYGLLWVDWWEEIELLPILKQIHNAVKYSGATVDAIQKINRRKHVNRPEPSLIFFTITITIDASLKFSEILAATFSATWLGLQERGPKH